MSKDETEEIPRYPNPYACAKMGCAFLDMNDESQRYLAKYRCRNPKMAGTIIQGEEKCPYAKKVIPSRERRTLNLIQGLTYDEVVEMSGEPDADWKKR